MRLTQSYTPKPCPAYPLYLLAILSVAASQREMDISASARSYYLELLIEQVLATRTRREYDVTAAYLAELAFEMLAHDVPGLGRAQLAEVSNRYRTWSGIELDETEQIKSLIADDILYWFGNSELRFRHEYVFSYFVAHYLASHLSDQPDAMQYI